VPSRTKLLQPTLAVSSDDLLLYKGVCSRVKYSDR